MPDDVTFSVLGVFKLGLSQEMLDSLRRRSTRRTLYSGPCALIDRRWGLALDATPHPTNRTRPVLWTLHSGPWQQWRLIKTGDGLVKIVSEHGGRVLTTDTTAGDGSWVWLETDRGRDNQQWRLIPTDDRLAFLIEARSSGHALDARTDTAVPAAYPDGSTDSPTPPILWSSHWAPWQQWMILRLPLT